MNYSNNSNDNKISTKFKVKSSLKDKKNNGKNKPWRSHKMTKDVLVQSYFNLGFNESLTKDMLDKVIMDTKKFNNEFFMKRFETAYDCANQLEFKVINENRIQLKRGNFCRNNLCPICCWLKSIKLSNEFSKIIENLNKNNEYKFLLLTLTVKNMTGDNLKESLDLMSKAWHNLKKNKGFKTAIKGSFRTLEITHDTEKTINHKRYYKYKEYYDKRNIKIGDLNPNYNMFHPHFHILLAVDKNYKKNNDAYISQEKWIELWQRALNVDYRPNVDIRTVNNINKGIKEVTKYSLKTASFIVGKRIRSTGIYIRINDALTDYTVLILTEALYNRRLLSYNGVINEIRNELKTSNKELKVENQYDYDLLLLYQWYNSTYGKNYYNYILTNKYSEKDKNKYFVEKRTFYKRRYLTN